MLNGNIDGWLVPDAVPKQAVVDGCLADGHARLDARRGVGCSDAYTVIWQRYRYGVVNIDSFGMDFCADAVAHHNDGSGLRRLAASK